MSENGSLLTTDDNLRAIFASLQAHEFLIQIMLTKILVEEGTGAQNVIDQILRLSRKTDHIRAGNESDAELLSDIAVQSQQIIEAIVQRARVGVV